MKYNYCVFRLDDITPGMNWDNFYKIKDIFDRYQIKPLIGVVPDNKDTKLNLGFEKEDFWKLIHKLSAEGWTIAQHGYQHLYVTKKSGILKAHRYSEFAGLEYSLQDEKIRRGKEILKQKGIDTDVFMAPAHTYDKDTLRALKDNGFQYVSDGYSRYPYEEMGLKFIPCMHVLPKRIQGLATACIHPNTVKVRSLSEIEGFIRKNRPLIVDYRIALEMDCSNVSKYTQGFYIVWNYLLNLSYIVYKRLKNSYIKGGG